MKLRAIGSGSPKLEVAPDLELHPESLQRPMLACGESALVLHWRSERVRKRMCSAI